MTEKIDDTSEGEWSLRSSFRSIKLGRSSRNVESEPDSNMVASKNHVDDEDKDSIGLVGARPSLHMAALKDFLFASERDSKKSPYSSGDQPLSVFENSFDLTEDRLRRIFKNLDQSKNGNISYDELRLGLKYHGNELGTSHISSEALVGLTRYLDADNSGEITFEEFSEGIRLMLLRTLIKKVRDSDRNKDLVSTEVFDYNSTSLKQYLLKGVCEVNEPLAAASFEASSKSLVDFFLEERGAEVSVRWIDITGKQASNIMKMVALKYRLHPLALEDALERTDHRPKADSYDGHYFIMVPVFQLNEAENSNKPPDAGHQKKRSWSNRPFNSQEHGTIEHNDTMMSDDEISTDEETDIHSENYFIGVQMTSIFITKPGGRTVITFNDERKEGRPWWRLQGELKKEYSKLRQYDGQHLAYRLLDVAEDKIGEIVIKLKTIVRKEMRSVVNDKYRDLNRIHSLKHQMLSMNRKFKSFERLLKHVIEDDSFSPEASIYLRDVLDNLEIHDEDLKSLIAKCESVDEDAEKFQARKMDNTLYTLTVISAVFLPAQFLTGKWIPLRLNSITDAVADGNLNALQLKLIFAKNRILTSVTQ